MQIQQVSLKVQQIEQTRERLTSQTLFFTCKAAKAILTLLLALSYRTKHLESEFSTSSSWYSNQLELDNSNLPAGFCSIFHVIFAIIFFTRSLEVL